MYRFSKKFMVRTMLMMVLLGGIIHAGGVVQTERDALKTFYTQTGGSNWNNTWPINDIDSDPCKHNWHGVSCTDDNTHINGLTLLGNNLTGSIPGIIENLPYMEVIYFENNNLSGTLPEELASLRSLRYLNLNRNNLTGDIHYLSKSENLQQLKLYHNQFSGSIPPGIGQFKFLNNLELADNTFTGNIPNMSGMNALYSLHLNNNQFSGSIPSSICDLGDHLGIINFSDNDLAGEIPSCMKTMTKIATYDFGLRMINNCDLYSSDQGLIDYINTNFVQTYDDIVNSNKCPSNHNPVTIAPIISYLLSDTGSTPLPPAKPAAPYGIQAVPVNMTSDKINITWHDGSNNENGFHIYRSRTVDGTKTRINSVGANVTSFQNSGLSACGSYYYWVKAYNSGGLSDFSDYANATTAPAAPIGLYTTNYVIRSTTLYWDNNVDSGCTVRYHVYAKYPEDSSYTKIDDNNDLTDGTTGNTNVDIQPETYIYYRVVAENSDGISGSMSCEVESGYRNALAESDNTLCKAAVGYAFNDKPLYPWASTDRSSEVLFTWDDVPLQYSSDGTSVELYANCFEIKYKVGTGIWNDYTDCLQNPFQSNGWQYQAFTVNQVATDTTISLSISTHYLYNGEHVYSDPIIITGKTLPAGSSGGGTTPLGSAPWIVTSNYYPGKIMVGWGARDAATRYEIYRGAWNGTSCSTTILNYYKSFSSGSRFYDQVGDWKKYCYKVKACNNVGCTDFSHAEYGSSGGGI